MKERRNDKRKEEGSRRPGSSPPANAAWYICVKISTSSALLSMGLGWYGSGAVIQVM